MVDKDEYHELVQRIDELEKELESTKRILLQQENTERCYRLLLENLGQIDRAIKKETDIEKMLTVVLETVCAIFQCDRTWILYPCDPEAASFCVPMEVSNPHYPGANALHLDVEMTPDLARAMRAALASEKPLMHGKGKGAAWTGRDAGRFGVKSEMLKALHPKRGKAWLFGIHQCSETRSWSTEEQHLFNEIGRRISDGLTCLLTLRKLKESEQQFRAVFEQAAVGVALCDSKTGNFVKVNKKYSEIVGYPSDELYRLTFQDITHPDDIHRHLGDFQLLLENKIEDFTLNKRYCRKDGSVVWGRITVSPLWKNGGRPERHISILQDITDQKNAENKLDTSENRYKDIFNNLLNVYIETDLDGVIRELSPSSEEMSGYRREELIGTNVLEYYADKEKRDELLKSLFLMERVTNFEADAIHKDGRRIPFSLTARLVRNHQGKPSRIIGMLRNIEERKKAENDIRESERRFRSIMEASPDPIVLYDMDGHTLYVNPAFTDLFGWPLEEVAGRRIDYVPEEAWPETRAILKRAKRGESFLNFKTQRYDRKRNIIDVDISIGVWKSIPGEPLGSVVILRDITRQKKADMQLQRVQKLEAIGTLAGGIAHDFNNILSGILGYSQLALMRLDNPEQVKKDIEGIQKAGKKATELVHQILTISRQSTQKKEPLEVGVVVKEALKLLQATIPATIEVKGTIVSDARVMANPTKIHQVIMNLATNAYHAMIDSKGVLSVSLKEMTVIKKNHLPELDLPAGRYLRLEVSDTGCGMDRSLIKKIFDPYFTTKEPDKGTGLGLAVVLSIIEEHKGKINVYSKLGVGSSFHVYLPIIEESEEPILLESESEPPALGSETVLMIDDDTGVVRTTQELLTEFGYSVAAFTNPVEAFYAYRKDPNKFDIVVTDMTMPGMTGFELSKKMLELNPGQPIILCTGFSESINREKALAIGIVEYFEKPIITWEIAKVIRSVLDNRK